MPLPGYGGSADVEGVHPLFPEDDVARKVRDVVDSKIGLALLISGTIGSALAVAAAAFVSFEPGTTWDAWEAIAALFLGIAAGRWADVGKAWRDKWEQRLMGRCFLAWLENVVGDPSAQGYELWRTIVSTARHSRFSGIEAALREADSEESRVGRTIVKLARESGYSWRSEDFRDWAATT